MIIPDVNLLICAYNADSQFHREAATWWGRCLMGDEPVGLLPLVLFGFVRISTSLRAFQNPLTVAEAAKHVRSWMAQPSVELLEGRPGHVDRGLALLESAGTAGNLVTDAQIAAAAIELGAVVHSADSDFARFENLRWFNPITGRKGGG